MFHSDVWPPYNSEKIVKGSTPKELYKFLNGPNHRGTNVCDSFWPGLSDARKNSSIDKQKGRNALVDLIWRLTEIGLYDLKDQVKYYQHNFAQLLGGSVSSETWEIFYILKISRHFEPAKNDLKRLFRFMDEQFNGSKCAWREYGTRFEKSVLHNFQQISDCNDEIKTILTLDIIIYES